MVIIYRQEGCVSSGGGVAGGWGIESLGLSLLAKSL